MLSPIVNILCYSDAEHEQLKKHELHVLWQKRQHEQYMKHGRVTQVSLTFMSGCTRNQGTLVLNPLNIVRTVVVTYHFLKIYTG